jgi:hypothetical protein
MTPVEGETPGTGLSRSMPVSVLPATAFPPVSELHKQIWPGAAKNRAALLQVLPAQEHVFTKRFRRGYPVAIRQKLSFWEFA